MVAIPARLEEIDEHWLTEALRASGHDVEVSGASFTPIGGTVGILGEVGLFDVSYAGPTDLPGRFVGKCALDDDVARMYNSIMLFYPRETGFYRDLATEVPLRVPTCYVDVEADGRHLLLLEYLDGATDGDVIEGVDFDTMKRLVGDMAGMHGRYWMDERVRDLPWALTWAAENFLEGVPLIQGFWEQLMANEPDLVPADMAALCHSTYLTDTERWLQRFAERPWTFIHGDFQLDNLLFRDDEIIVVDWQGCMVSFPGMDLAYFLATSATEESVAREDELLDHYRATLAASGGPEWSHDELVDDLAWSMLHHVSGEAIPYQMDYSAMGAHAEHLRQRFDKCMHECIRAAQRWDLVGRLSKVA